MAKVDNANEQAAPSGAPAGIEPLAEGPRKYALGLLLLIYVLNFLDRQVVNILAEPIKVELGLADWQLGALTGLAFALFYTVLGLPIGDHVLETPDLGSLPRSAIGRPVGNIAEHRDQITAAIDFLFQGF